MTNVVSKEAVPAVDYLKNSFRKVEYDSRITNTTYDFHYPVTGTRNTTCLRWVIPRSGGNRVPNIEKLVLAMDLKCTNAAKDKRPPVDIAAAPTNNFANSICGCLTISYNNTVVCKIDNYPIYNYLSLILNNSENDFKTWAATRLFYKEEEDEELDDAETKTWLKRRLCLGGPITKPKTIKSKGPEGEEIEIANPDLGKFQYGDKPVFFVSSLDHYLETPALLSDCDIHVQLDLSKSGYAFHSKDQTPASCDIAVDIERARLFVPQMTLNDQLYTQLKNRLSKEPMRQFYTSTMVNTHTISTGDKTSVFSSICQGMSPNRVYIMLQESDRYQGQFDLNKLKFPRVYNAKNDPFMLQKASMKLNSVDIDPLSCDDAGSFRDEYFRLMSLTNQDVGKNSCSITFKNFLEHNCILVYDLTATMNQSEPPLVPLTHKGHLRLKLEFDKATTCSLTLIVVAECSSSLTIEDSGKVTVATL